MKTIEKAIISALVLSILLTMTGFTGRCENISQKIFRLHVLANSDSAEDQALKLKVRDKILEYSEELFKEAQSREEAKNIASKHIDEFKSVAEREIHKQGYNYPVTVEVTNMYFNTRHYNKVSMPAGNYDALRVLIGSGQGKNWWCVMFPPMCLPVAEEQEELEEVLDSSEMDIVCGAEEYEIRFKIVEWYEYAQYWVQTLFEENSFFVWIADMLFND